MHKRHLGKLVPVEMSLHWLPPSPLPALVKLTLEIVRRALTWTKWHYNWICRFVISKMATGLQLIASGRSNCHFRWQIDATATDAEAPASNLRASLDKTRLEPTGNIFLFMRKIRQMTYRIFIALCVDMVFFAEHWKSIINFREIQKKWHWVRYTNMELYKLNAKNIFKA